MENQPDISFLPNLLPNDNKPQSLYSHSINSMQILERQYSDIFNFSAHQLSLNPKSNFKDIIKDTIFYLTICHFNMINNNKDDENKDSFPFGYFDIVENYIIQIGNIISQKQFYNDKLNFEIIEVFLLYLPLYLSVLDSIIDKGKRQFDVYDQILKEIKILIENLLSRANGYEKTHKTKYAFYLREILFQVNRMMSKQFPSLLESKIDKVFANREDTMPFSENKLESMLIDIDRPCVFNTMMEKNIINNRITKEAIDLSRYRDNKFELKLIGSYSLGLKCTEESVIDMVVLSKNNNIAYVELNDISQWIMNFNQSDFALFNDSSQHRESSVLFFTLYINDFQLTKKVNIYLFKDWFWECNELFLMKIFFPNSPLCLVHSFYVPLFQKIGLIHGSEVSLFIITFLDYKYKLLNKNSKICKKKKLIKKEGTGITIKQSDYFYYEMKEDIVNMITKRSAYDLVCESLEVLAELLTNKQRDNVLVDRHYLFRVKFLYDLSEEFKQLISKIRNRFNIIFNYKSIEDYFNNGLIN